MSICKAAAAGDKAAVLRLMGYGIRSQADIKAAALAREERASDGGTCLHAAAAANHLSIVEIILDKRGCDFDAVTTLTRNTALHAACKASAGGSHVAVAKLLIVGGRADPRRPEPMHKKKARRLSARNVNGFSPLHYACKVGDVRLAEALLDEGAEANAECAMAYGQFRPLHLAAQCERVPELATLLIARGAEIDGRDAYGRTPLHIASTTGSETLVRLLLENGADPQAVSDRGMRALGGPVSRAFNTWLGSLGEMARMRRFLRRALNRGLARAWGCLHRVHVSSALLPIRGLPRQAHKRAENVTKNEWLLPPIAVCSSAIGGSPKNNCRPRRTM